MSPQEVLKKYWGYDSFRPNQLEIINSVLSGKDTLALLPTGGGKSICFHVPALMKDGLCIVISPLIALMKDQVQNLRKLNISANAIYSGMYRKDIDIILDNCVFGKVKFLYLSPERLLTQLAIERIKNMNVNLIAVDEAHCISQWGYDFRPAYLSITNIRELQPDAPVLALTATATSKVVQDIQDKLEFNPHHVIQSSFSRSNLAYVVVSTEGKRQKLFDVLKKVGGSAIVYVRSRKQTKELVMFLKTRNISADFYHAGLSPEERSLKQDSWIKNNTRVIISTNAFGMGIDKPDVRLVVHMDLPDSLEAYFQEAGRAGRDGRKAFAILLYNESDKINLEKQFDNSFPEIAYIKKVYQRLGSYFQLATGSGLGDSFDFEISNFCQQFDLRPVPAFHALKVLKEAGWIDVTDAVFIPASLRVRVDREGLYAYQIKHKGMDLLLKTILRTYQGAFNHYVNVYENQLAKFLGVSKAQIIADLKKMQIDGILDFRQQVDKPQLIFTHERVPQENMTIDIELYNFRKRRYKLNIEAAINYATSVKCRSRTLLEYFGETTSGNCGICDVCLSQATKNFPEDKFEKIKSAIESHIKFQELELENLVDEFPMYEENLVLEVLNYLIDNKFINKTESGHLKWLGKY